MGGSLILLSILALNFFSNITFAFDPSPLQDFCVADISSSARFGGGRQCKDPATVEANDFFFSGLHLAGNASNPSGSAATAVSVNQIPGLNTLGMILVRVDLRRNGFFPPHFHHRATELVTVLEGSVEIGFVTSNPSYKNFRKVVRRGDVFVVPVGLVHYARNVGRGNAVALVVFNSQNPGFTLVPDAVFGAEPAIDGDFLSRAFMLDKEIVEELQNKF
ncbi:RmlC-like cupins superfamily protein [Perilla frutescens var. hirtella]|uniref:Germin-like protein n=1 Tax=Perilla frutescens var. hirtella TaxID=608512 RepID=A0AAD4J5F0_PERFH|nr:RmlC-like cupins superfamily protein [Perilla frutescens var. hirtella]